ncbi:MAG: hypothetical protein MUQ27_13110 [Acidimicrobiia bacterium]|nr:hypothetical protein [Acidimicrobiia bacterium]
MSTEQRYTMWFSRGTARVGDVASWVRLTATATVLVGPLKWMLIASGRLDPIPATRSVEQMRPTERRMKRVALDHRPLPRRYEPDRDGWWDEYSFQIDEDFTHLADRVRDHRMTTAAR